MKRHFLKFGISIVLLVHLTFTGCVTKDVDSESDDPVEIAKREVTRRLGWKRIEVQAARFVNDRWLIIIWSLPKMPGGHTVVEISKDGEFLSFGPGA
jgi:hypothetical protein